MVPCSSLLMSIVPKRSSLLISMVPKRSSLLLQPPLAKCGTAAPVLHCICLGAAVHGEF